MAMMTKLHVTKLACINKTIIPSWYQLVNNIIGQGTYYSIGDQAIVGLKLHDRLAREVAKNPIDDTGIIVQAGKYVLQRCDVISPVTYTQYSPFAYHGSILLLEHQQMRVILSMICCYWGRCHYGCYT